MSSAVTEPAGHQSDNSAAPPLDPFECIRVGSQLGRCPERILPFVQAYISVGLFGPARELVLNSDSRDHSECRSVLARFAAKPSGRVPWGSVEHVFRAGLLRLLERHANLVEWRDKLKSLPESAEIYRTVDRGLQLSHRGRPGLDRWIGGLMKTEDLVARIKLGHGPGDQFCPNYLICGDRFGAALRHVHHETSRMFLTFSPRLFVAEIEPLALAAALCIEENLEALLDERTHIVLGAEAMHALSGLLRSNTNLNPPLYLISIPPYDSAKELAAQLREMIDERASIAQAIAIANNSHYSVFRIEDWAARFRNRKSEPLTVLGITSRFTTVLQYAMRDLKTTFERLGHKFETLLEPTDHDLLQPISLAKAVADHKPDLIFCIDHLRREYAAVLPSNVPYVGWVQDMLPNLTCVEAGQSIGPLDFYLCSARADLVLSYSYPESQGQNVTLVTDDSLYSAEPLPPDELAAYRCDFSFVSNQSETPEGFHRRLCASFQDGSPGRMLCDELFRIMKHELVDQDPPGYPRRSPELIAEALQQCGGLDLTQQVQDAISRQFVQPLGELMFRQKALEWVAEYCDINGKSLHLYGNGWQDHPRFARYARGVASNGPMLRSIYQASTINLQINGYGCIHPRLLDGLASGGFFLIRQTGLDLIGRELAQLRELKAKPPQAKVCTLTDAPAFRPAFAAERLIAGGSRKLEEIELDQNRLAILRELAHTRRVGNSVFPEFADVSFGSRKQFFERADFFFNDKSSRIALAQSMRRKVIDHFTYTALVRQLLQFIEDRLARRVGEGVSQ